MRTWTILIFVNLLLAGAPLVSFSQSQPPPPGPPEISKSQLNKAEQNYTDSNADKNTPDKPPVVVEAIKTPPTDSKKNNITKYGDDKSSHEWTLSNVLLAIFNAVLAISTVFLWWSTRKLWKSTHKAFIATNRPRLRVRRIHSDGLSKTGIEPTWVYITNIGGSNATDIVFKVVYALRTGSTRRPPWIEKLSDSPGHGSLTLAPGEGQQYDPRTKFSFEIGDIDSIIAGDKTFLIIGTVRYQDANKTERGTGFGWVYDPGTGELSKPEKDDQYNYED